jgi:glycosyltransferase involved in cell wall biosynthesis
MKILIVHDYGTLNGGAEHMSVMLRDRLCQRGHQARLFTSSAHPLPLPLQADHTCFGTLSLLREATAITNPSAVFELRRVLRQFRPDVVHVRMFLTQLSPAILPLVRGLPSLLHVVNYDLICPKNTKQLPSGAPCHHRAGAVCSRTGCLRWRALVPALVRRALTDLSVFDFVVTNSLWVRQRLEAEGIHVDDHVWNGVPVTAPRPPLSSPPTIGFAGRFVQKKGIDLLVRAMQRVVREIPDARLRLLGDGPERPCIERLIDELELRSCVELLGHRTREEVNELLGRAWVQVVPSRWEEPFGLVAAEAMMRGTAVVAADSGGVSEVVQDGVTGYRFATGSVDSMAEAIQRVLRDSAAAEQMGRAGRAFALEHLTEDRVVTRFETLYRKLVHDPRPHTAASAERQARLTLL